MFSQMMSYLYRNEQKKEIEIYHNFCSNNSCAEILIESRIGY